MINYKVTTVEQKGNQATFEIEPLEVGFGHTLASCLRRVLLSSLEGAAINSVKIAGVSHEFSTVPGVVEDVIQIILNLKKVRVRMLSDKTARLTLKASGKGEVTAGDIDTAGGAEIINPDLHIASLTTPGAKLAIDMTADKGVGYVMADQKHATEIGVMPVDSLYTPVMSVNYKVDQTRVGRSSNYEKITLDVTTDGTIQPEEALMTAARILSSYFKQMYDPMFDEVIEVAPVVNDGVMKMSVEELDLPVRITNALKAIEIDTVEKLVNTQRAVLLKAKNLGVQSITLISQKLEERGLSLSEA